MSNILFDLLIKSSTQRPQWKALKSTEQAIDKPRINSEARQSQIIPDFDQDNVKCNIELVFPSGKGHGDIKLGDQVQIVKETVQHSIQILKKDIVFEKGFQDFGSKVECARNVLSRAARELNHSDIGKQLAEDDIYTKELGALVRSVLLNIPVNYSFIVHLSLTIVLGALGGK